MGNKIFIRKIRKVYYILIILIANFVGFTQENATNLRNRDLRKILVNDSTVYELNIISGPIVIGDSIIQMYPNEKFYFEVDTLKNRLSNYKLVHDIKYKDKTLIVEFKQVIDKQTHKQMMLIVTNPYQKELYFKSSIYLLSKKNGFLQLFYQLWQIKLVMKFGQTLSLQ
jgi:hypothetical protein